ncbi:MAG: phosphoribosylamine--glycine ligase [Burkholderiaceae bacterium]
MKVLVIGNGGREHALAWKLAQSKRVQMIYVAPGNGGTAADIRLRNVPITDLEELAEFAQREHMALTVVGPEAPLAAGAVDLFRGRGLRVFGPTRAAAQLESSKAFAKAFMRRHGIPTAVFETFTDAAQAHAYVDAQGAPIVIKADGLAAGKGVVVATTPEQAHAAIAAMLAQSAAGGKLGVSHNAGADATSVPRIVIEEFLEGEEASFIVMCDGKNIVPLATSQDHKRLFDADAGPNTGGMGAYSPAPVVTPNVHARAMHEIVMPTIAGLAAEGIEYTGFLYAGLMIDSRGQPRTVEFNCRLGDPEAQVILMRLKTDLLDVLLHATEGRLNDVEMQWDRRFALGVVLAAAGYPSQPRRGDLITGLPAETPDSIVFHAGTTLQDKKLVTSGGRVLCATALGEPLKTAQTRAYGLVKAISFDGALYRHDIGHRAIKR